MSIPEIFLSNSYRKEVEINLLKYLMKNMSSDLENKMKVEFHESICSDIQEVFSKGKSVRLSVERIDYLNLELIRFLKTERASDEVSKDKIRDELLNNPLISGLFDWIDTGNIETSYDINREDAIEANEGEIIFGGSTDVFTEDEWGYLEVGTVAVEALYGIDCDYQYAGGPDHFQYRLIL